MISRNSLSDTYPVRKLGEVVDFLDHLRRPVTESSRKAGPYPYYGANGLQGTIDNFVFDEPLVLLAEDGGHFDNPDRGIAYRISGRTWVNNHAHVLRPRSATDLGYLCRVLENYDVTPFVTGTTRGKLTKAGASEIPIPLPPVAEQKRIAAILDQADALRAKRREALAELDKLTQSIFLEMFGDPISNSKNLPLKTLGDATTFENGDRSSNYPSGDDIQKSGVLFLSTRNIRDHRLDLSTTSFITDEKFRSLSRGKARKDDLLITLRGTLGSCCIFNCRYDTAFINAQMMIVRPKTGLRSEYLHALLTSSQFQDLFSRIGQGAAVPQLTATQLGQLCIPFPTIEDQSSFVTKIQSASTLQQEQEVHMFWLDTLFASLQHRAFRGEL